MNATTHPHLSDMIAMSSSEESQILLEDLTPAEADAIEAALEDYPAHDEATATQETLGDFRSSRRHYWSDRGRMVKETYAGFPALRFEGFQLTRGLRRQNMLVIDSGARRIVLHP